MVSDRQNQTNNAADQSCFGIVILSLHHGHDDTHDSQDLAHQCDQKTQYNRQDSQHQRGGVAPLLSGNVLLFCGFCKNIIFIITGYKGFKIYDSVCI